MLSVLIVGDIVGAPGRRAFGNVATRYKHKGKADVIIVNGENAAGGSGITLALATELLAAGADVITLGDHTWRQKQIVGEIDSEPRLIRPANFAPDCPGKGIVTVPTEKGNITVINLIGRVFMDSADCPFRTVDQLLDKKNLSRVTLVDMHAEATSEKIAMGRYLDGRVTSVTGTHTHVQTSDETILPGGTAYITDVGMTGAKDSVIGREWKPVVERFLTGMPQRFNVAEDDVALEGVLVKIDETTGRASSIKRVRERIGRD
ncbi:MAG: TIGR00282 family metallophosphoesterase [Verrucomicrobia bacterium]|nr:TIGR00282 family metallophosphoesterase [Verrucomicrobiota bacterium]MDA1087477.1 TIGR00282 family metallophosphoesterase [Verrucomicrobiota bacterium]